VLKDGASAGIAVVGNDGAIGVALFMGGETTTNRAIVQSAGSAYRMTGARLKEEFERLGETLHILPCYTQALITQMAQPRCATGITRWTSNCAAGCCCLSTGYCQPN
jgi:hypothetical protein